MKTKNSKAKRILSLVLCFGLILQQMGFAQIASELNVAGYLAKSNANLVQAKFRPLELRYFSYNSVNDNVKLLVDKGDQKELNNLQVQEQSKSLLNYFLIGITLPNDTFWVNLRPDSENQIIDQYLEKTDIGKIMLEADVQLKKDTARFTSPETSEGRVYWNKLYKKAEQLYGTQNTTIPTLTRPWIVPGEVIIRESNGSAYVYKAVLKVMLEQDYLKNSTTYNFKDDRAKALNEYSSQLIKELIIPNLTKEVNSSKRYAALRQVFHSLVLAHWFKSRFTGKSGSYAAMIDTKNLTNLTSQTAWSKTTYFKQYQESFNKGEYNVQEPVYTPSGQVIRSYFSGGMQLMVPGNIGTYNTTKDQPPITENSVAINVTADKISLPLTAKDVMNPEIKNEKTIKIFDNIFNQFNAMAIDLKGEGATYRDIPELADRMEKVQKFLVKISERLNSQDPNEAIYPESTKIRTDENEAAITPTNKIERVGIYYVAGNPLHWDHLLVALEAMAQEGLDKIIFGIQSGKDTRKPILGLNEKYRYELCKEELALFSPLFDFAENTSASGEEDIFRILKLNPNQKIDAFYIVGSDHYNRWSKAEAPDNLLRGTPEYNAWVKANGREPSPDTLQKLEDYPQKYGMDAKIHSISVLFAERPGDPIKSVEHKLKHLKTLPPVGNSSSTAIRKALAALEKGTDISSLDSETLQGLAYLPYMGFKYIQKHAKTYGKMLAHPEQLEELLKTKQDLEKKLAETKNYSDQKSILKDLAQIIRGIGKYVGDENLPEADKVIVRNWDDDPHFGKTVAEMEALRVSTDYKEDSKYQGEGFVTGYRVDITPWKITNDRKPEPKPELKPLEELLKIKQDLEKKLAETKNNSDKKSISKDLAQIIRGIGKYIGEENLSEADKVIVRIGDDDPLFGKTAAEMKALRVSQDKNTAKPWDVISLNGIGIIGEGVFTISDYLAAANDLGFESPTEDNADHDLAGLLNKGYLVIPNLHFKEAKEPYKYQITAKGYIFILSKLYPELDKLKEQLQYDIWEEGNFDYYSEDGYATSKQKKTRSDIKKTRDIINAAEEKLTLQFLATAFDLPGQNLLSPENCALAYAKYKKAEKIPFDLNFSIILSRLAYAKILSEVKAIGEETEPDNRIYIFTLQGLTELINSATILIGSSAYMDNVANVLTSSESDPLSYSPENTAMRIKAEKAKNWAYLRLALQFAATNEYLTSEKASFNQDSFFEFFKKYAEANSLNYQAVVPYYLFNKLIDNGYLKVTKESWKNDDDREYIAYEYKFNKKGLSAIQSITDLSKPQPRNPNGTFAQIPGKNPADALQVITKSDKLHRIIDEQVFFTLKDFHDSYSSLASTPTLKLDPMAASWQRTAVRDLVENSNGDALVQQGYLKIVNPQRKGNEPYKFILTPKALVEMATNAQKIIREAINNDKRANIFTSSDEYLEGHREEYSKKNSRNKEAAEKLDYWASVQLLLYTLASSFPSEEDLKEAEIHSVICEKLFDKYKKENSITFNMDSYFAFEKLRARYLRLSRGKWDDMPAYYKLTPLGREKIKQIQKLMESSNPEISSTSEPVEKGGIDLNIQLMTIQRMGSMSGLTFKLPQLSPEALKQFNIAQEMQQLKNMVKAGIEPSGERLKGLVAACVQKGRLRTEANGLLLCLVDVLKLQENNATESSAELKEALVIVDSQS